MSDGLTNYQQTGWPVPVNKTRKSMKQFIKKVLFTSFKAVFCAFLGVGLSFAVVTLFITLGTILAGVGMVGMLASVHRIIKNAS